MLNQKLYTVNLKIACLPGRMYTPAKGFGDLFGTTKT